MIEYLLFVFLASLGVLQVAAARGRLRGLWFFKSPLAAYLFAALSIGGAFGWFFLDEDRNRPGVEGFQQFQLFLAGAFLALLVTLLVSSLLKRRDMASHGGGEIEPGLDALREMTYFQALRRSFNLRKGL